jgi:hypothetical protein
VTTHASVSASWRTLVASCIDVALAVASLILALATAPVRFAGCKMGYRPTHLRPASTAAIDIQIHLEDARGASQLRTVLQATLKRAAQTWAPHALPLDRIVVAAGVAPEGKADIYDDWLQDSLALGDVKQRSLAVISLGLRQAERDLEIYEIAGALSTQIHKLVDERYRRSTTGSRSDATPLEAPSVGERALAAPAASTSRVRRTVSKPVAEVQPAQGGSRAIAATPADALADPTADSSTVRAMLDVLNRSQPLDGAATAETDSSSRSVAA